MKTRDPRTASEPPLDHHGPLRTASGPLWIPDKDKTMNRLKKSMNDEANAALQDQDNFLMEGIMNLTKSFEANATNRGEKRRILSYN